MGGSSNLVYPEVPLHTEKEKKNHFKTLVHFPEEKGWAGQKGRPTHWRTD